VYCRYLGTPMVRRIDNVLGMTEQKYKTSFKEVQFQSVMRVIVVMSIFPFQAGYFLGLPKCFLWKEIMYTS